MTNFTVNYANAGFSGVTIPATSFEDLKAKVEQMFPDAKNAEATLSGTTVTFAVRQGSKA